MKTEFRKCKDLDMFTLDRSPKSCKHATTFCKKNCYNKKLYAMYKDMKIKDKRCDEFWENSDEETFKEFFESRKKPVKRFRFSTRGETFSNVTDIVKVHKILVSNPKVTFWIPTRAWRKPSFKLILETIIKDLPNARLQASLDPSNTEQEIEDLKNSGWSTMFFGDNNETEDRVKCPKTWNKAKKLCSTCKIGCFKKEQTHIHLKKH